MKILVFFLMVFVALQFTSTHKAAPKIDESIALDTDDKVMKILKKSCYACHSYETKYDTFISNIAPFSFVVDAHVNDGRKALNFSEYKNITQEKKQVRFKRAIKTINNAMMPLPSYVSFHEEAKLTKEEKKILLKWFEKELVK